MAKPEYLCGHDEMWEMWDRKVELVKELCSERLEERGGHVRKHGVQESTDPHKVE
jgi:hypothetical protein